MQTECDIKSPIIDNLLTLLKQIKRLPLDDLSKIHLDKSLYTGAADVTLSYQLIYQAIKGDFKGLKKCSLSWCFETFMLKDPEKHPIVKITAMCMLGIYYRHKNRIDVGQLYFDLYEYLSMPNSGHTLCNVIVYYSSEAESGSNDSIDKYLLKATKFFDLFLGYYLKYVHKLEKSKNVIKDIPDTAIYFRLVDQLSSFLLHQRVHEKWDQYCIFANKLLRIDKGTPILFMLVENLLGMRKLISSKEWCTLPFYLESFALISECSEISGLYQQLAEINSYTWTKTDEYIIKICIYLWSNKKFDCFRRGGLFCSVLRSCSNGSLFVLIRLLSIPDIIINYTERINTSRSSSQLITIKNEQINSLTRLSKYFNTEKQIRSLQEELENDNTTFLLNLNLLCKHSSFINGIFGTSDAIAYIFWYLLENPGMDIYPGLYFTETITGASFLEQIIIDERGWVSKLDTYLQVWRALHIKCNNYPYILNQVKIGDISLRHFLDMLQQIKTIRKLIFNEKGGLDYLSIKERFDRNVTVSDNKTVTMNLNSDDNDDLSNFLLTNFIQSFMPDVQNSFSKSPLLSDTEHLVFFALFKLHQYPITSNAIIFNQFSSNISELVKLFGSILNNPRVAEILDYYYKLMFRPALYKILVNVTSLLEFFIEILMVLCRSTQNTEELLDLCLMYPSLKSTSSSYKFRIGSLCEPIKNYISCKIKVLMELGNYLKLDLKLSDLVWDFQMKVHNNITINLHQIINVYSEFLKYESVILENIRLMPPKYFLFEDNADNS